MIILKNIRDLGKIAMAIIPSGLEIFRSKNTKDLKK